MDESVYVCVNVCVCIKIDQLACLSTEEVLALVLADADVGGGGGEVDNKGGAEGHGTA
jgi:hypothetical protein